MPKKIKNRPILTKEERDSERKAKEDERARQAAGIQDDFQAKGFEFVDWIQGHRHKVMTGLGLVVLAGLIVSGFEWSAVSRDEDASRSFVEAHEAFTATLGGAPAAVTGETDEAASKYSFADEKERATKARDMFQVTIDEHGSSTVAIVASLYVGHTSLSLKEYDKAIAAYQTFLDGIPRSDPFRFLALDGQSAALEEKGEKDGAIGKLQMMLNIPGKVNKDVALIRIAYLYQDTGNFEKAKEAAQRVVNEFSESPLKSTAEEILSKLETPKS